MVIKLQRNEDLAAEGAISRDRLDEVRNEQRRAQAGLAEAQAGLAEAQQVLAELQAGTRSQVIDQAIADIAQDQAEIKLINAQLANARVVAPMGGKIAKRFAQVGDVASAGKVLFEIIAQGKIELQLKVPENQLSQIKPGQTVNITADHNKNLKIQGQVQEIVPIVEAQTRQGTVNVILPNNNQLQPGMFLRGEIEVSSKNGLAIPMEAVVPQSVGQAKVFVLQPDKTVVSRSVTTGEILSEEKIQILSGLNPGESVVVKGAAFVRDGDLVEVAP
jgi:RND family efflux transporter MFP subunit